VPVVATDAGAVPEVVGDAARLVAVGDEEGFASALSDVLDHPEVAASLVERGTERAARFTWADCATGLVAMYEEAIACK
jgi:glycosyltransferase involved in cell wall biosynthesis